VRIKVELTWLSGLLDEDNQVPPEPLYELVNADTGELLTDIEFRTYEQMEDFIARQYPVCERWQPPPASEEDKSELNRVFALLGQGVNFDPATLRQILISHLYQVGWPQNTLAKIREVLGHLK